jgi:Protein of unknown function (DUF2459)
MDPDRRQVTAELCARSLLSVLLSVLLLGVSARAVSQPTLAESAAAVQPAQPQGAEQAKPEPAAAVEAKPQPPAAETKSANGAVIYVVRRGWHIDIGFAVSDIRPPLEFVASDFPGSRYIFFGFGDRRYLLAKHHYGPALLEALWPGPGLVLATAIKASPGDAFGALNVTALEATDAQLKGAQDYLRRALAHGDSAPYAPGPYEGSLYYESTATYSGLHTCNTWAAEALHAAGLSIRSAHVLFAGQLWRRVQRLRRQQASPSTAGRAFRSTTIATVN